MRNGYLGVYRPTIRNALRFTFHVLRFRYNSPMPNLPLTNLHRWDVTPEEAIAIQHSLRDKVSLTPDLGEVKLVAGVDISAKDVARAAVVLLSYPALEVVEVALSEKPLNFP